MKSEVEPADDPEKLEKNLSERFESAELNDGMIEVKLEEPERLSYVPGVDTYTKEEEERDGVGGRPLDQKAYARLGTREDVVKAFLATVDGYDLVILDSDREWDLKVLRLYNPGIRNLKQSEPADAFEIEKGIEIDEVDDIGIEVDEEEVEQVYRFLQP